MSNRELIEEARQLAKDQRRLGREHNAIITDRLSASLEAMELPEGWEPSEYTNGYGHQVAGIEDEWNARHGGGEWLRDATGHKAIFTTAREAMAALGEKP